MAFNSRHGVAAYVNYNPQRLRPYMNDIDPLVAVLLTILAVIVARFAYMMLVSGGKPGHYWQAQRIAGRWLRDAEFAAKVDALNQPPKPPEPPKPSAEPIRLLTLLQRDGRLLDFLMEDVAAAGDADLGAGVREIHRHCQKALREHLVLAPVLSQEENTAVEIPEGFDPSAIRLIGNVTGQPPFKGTLIHRGWRMREIKLPPSLTVRIILSCSPRKSNFRPRLRRGFASAAKFGWHALRYSEGRGLTRAHALRSTSGRATL